MRFVLDESRGELRVLGKRHFALAMDSFCSCLDSQVGSRVAEVIMNNLRAQDGRARAADTRKEYPEASVEELIRLLIRYCTLVGLGEAQVTVDKSTEDSIMVDVLHPYASGVSGSSKPLIASWWCGALGVLFDRRFSSKSLAYDPESDLLKCVLVSK